MVKMALVNIALYCCKAEIRVPVVGWWWWVGGANRFSCQTHNQVTLGCFWVGLLLLGLAWLWGYDNLMNLMKLMIRDGQKSQKLDFELAVHIFPLN